MGLRLSEGIDTERFAARTGVALGDAVDLSVLDRAIAEDYLTHQDHRLTATHQGRLRLDALLAALLLLLPLLLFTAPAMA